MPFPKLHVEITVSKGRPECVGETHGKGAMPDTAINQKGSPQGQQMCTLAVNQPGHRSHVFLFCFIQVSVLVSKEQTKKTCKRYTLTLGRVVPLPAHLHRTAIFSTGTASPISRPGTWLDLDTTRPSALPSRSKPSSTQQTCDCRRVSRGGIVYVV